MSDNNVQHKIITNTDIVSQARSWIGTKYHHQGRLKKSVDGYSPELASCEDWSPDQPQRGQTNGGVDCIGLIVGGKTLTAIQMAIILAGHLR